MVKAVRTLHVAPYLPTELAPLERLAMNFRWAWDAPTREVFKWADKDLWETTGNNPIAMLGQLSAERIRTLVDDQAFINQLQSVADDLDRYLAEPRWAQTQDPKPPHVAYFSAEFGITEVMQVYSGGLGILAGDHLKAASDLGLPLVGIGLLYRHGYFRQHLDAAGWQREQYPDLNPYDLPLQRLTENNDGEPVAITIEVGDRDVKAQIWKAQVGRVPLLLMDTDLVDNHPEDRTITDRLYGGDEQHRLRQEIVLGIGGIRALDEAVRVNAIDLSPVIFHANEGHAGFLQFERIRRFVENGVTFEEALEQARVSVLFTTHTPVPAGIDRFPRSLIDRYFTRYAEEVGVGIEQIREIGAEPWDGAGDVYNMAMMGLRLSAAANGVSALHGEVSREMFSDLWPGVEPTDVPIMSVTNGVHASTWVSSEMSSTLDRVLDPDWAHNPEAWTRVDRITDDQLWKVRNRGRESLVTFVRSHVREKALRRGERSSLAWIDTLLDPGTLTIGFARRFATYKRATLLLSQPDRLRALLCDPERPVQLVFAGKAHPKDDGGKGLIRDIVSFAQDHELRDRVVFLEDYDMCVARAMLAGSDVWLNNPRRPHEASGTSGEKAVLNGGLHFSVLDGWWDEMFDPGNATTPPNGFAIGGREQSPSQESQDEADATSLFETLERIVIPTFYDHADGPLPRRWLAMVRRSLSTLGPNVLACRMVQDYTNQLYTPLAERAERLTANNATGALELASWRHRVRESWSGVSIGELSIDGNSGTLGEARDVKVCVELGQLEHTDVEVQLVYGVTDADGTILSPNVRVLEGSDGTYKGEIALNVSGEYGVTVRVVPSHPDLRSWAETGLVVWADS